MTIRSSTEVKKALIKKGMTGAQGAHHLMLTLKIDGQVKALTRLSRNAQEIDDYLGSLMAKQCHLSNKQFWALVDCTLTGEEWASIVSGKDKFRNS